MHDSPRSSFRIGVDLEQSKHVVYVDYVFLAELDRIFVVAEIVVADRADRDRPGPRMQLPW